MPRARAGGPGPFLKWAGGKGKLLPFLEPLFPERFRAYHEPFLGAGAVFFHLAARGRIAALAHLSDVNPDLVLAFRMVKEEPKPLIREVYKLCETHSAEHYYALRDRFNRAGRRLGDLKRAALVIYLNKTGYNGLYRVNASGGFNVPYGRYDYPRIPSPEALRLAAQALERATLEVRDFSTVLERASSGDFVYLDPPYDPLTATAKFTSYARKGFGEDEQRQLADVFAKLDARGVQVLLSNHDTPLVRELYRRYPAKERVNTWRAINSDISRRGRPVREVAIRNYRG